MTLAIQMECMNFTTQKDKFPGFLVSSLFKSAIIVLEVLVMFYGIIDFVITNQNAQILFPLNTTSFIQFD